MINLNNLIDIEVKCVEKGFKPLWSLFEYLNKNSTRLSQKDKIFFIQKYDVSEVFLNGKIQEISDKKKAYFKKTILMNNLDQIFAKGISPKDFERNLRTD